MLRKLAALALLLTLGCATARAPTTQQPLTPSEIARTGPIATRYRPLHVGPIVAPPEAPARKRYGVLGPFATPTVVDVTAPCGSLPGAKNDGTVNVVPVVACWVAASSAGGVLHFKAGTYKWLSTPGLTISTPYLMFVGDGVGSTTIVVDDTAGAGVAITVAFGAHHPTFRDLTFATPSTARTAGDTILVKGGGWIWRTPSDNLGFTRIEHVAFLRQFIGVHLTDGTHSITDGMGLVRTDGAWETYVEDVEMRDMAPGGAGVFQESPNGGELYMRHVFMWGPFPNTTLNAPLAGVRVWDTADDVFDDVSSVFAQTGLLMDPPTGHHVNVMMINGCLWDSTVTRPVNIVPATGATVDQVTFVDGWFGQTGTVSNAAVNISGPAHGISFIDGRVIEGTGGVGILATGPSTSGVYITGTRFINGGYGFRASGALQNFSVMGAACEPWAAIGVGAPSWCVFVDVSSDFYNIIGNTCGGSGGVSRCSGAVVNDSGGAHKNVANNL